MCEIVLGLVTDLGFWTSTLFPLTTHAFRGVVPRGSGFRHRQRNVDITDVRRCRKTVQRPGSVPGPGAST